MESRKKTHIELLKYGAFYGFICTFTITAYDYFFEHKDFSIYKFLLSVLVFSLTMGLLEKYYPHKK